MLVAIELTVPRKKNCEEAHEKKNLKYADLMADCKNNGWGGWLCPMEICYRGFPAQSMWKLLARLRLSGRACKKALRRLAKAAERSPA